MGGKLAHRLQHLHQKYGPVVRIGPNELSFVATSVETWRTIYSRRPQEMPKFLGGTGLHPPYNGVAGIEASTQGAHARIRKAMSPAFSERALIDQEEFITSYIEKLLSILRRSDPKPAKHDFARLFNWMAFDIIGDLALGESFEGLEQQRYHSWVATIYAGIKAIAFLQFVLFYNLEGFLHIITPQRLAEERDRFYQLAFDKTDARLARNENRRDFLSYMESSTMSTQEIHTTFSTLLVAGSESSATHLGGTIFLCLTHPAVYARLRNEIRSAFPRKEDITFQAARNLEFMGCVMQESFRVYPPSPATIPRVVPMPGEQIGDSWVSGGVSCLQNQRIFLLNLPCTQTVVGINQWSTYHSGLNFRDPETFDPERWLSPAVRPTKYDEDHRDVLQPFSYGSRDCIGRS